MKEKFLSITFVGILFIFFALGIIFKDQKISLLERRYLTTKETLNKDPFTNLDVYLSDQFPFRNTFLSLYSFFDRVILGNKENNNIYKKGKVLIEKNYPLQEKNIEKFSQKINTIAEKYLNKDNRVFYALLPDKSYFLEEKEYQKLDFQKLIKKVEKEIVLPYIDLIPLFQLQDYYNTDIHLKQEAYQKVVEVLAKNYNFSLQNIFWEQQKNNNFYGSSYAKGAYFAKPEELNFYTNAWTEQADVWHLEYGKKKVYNQEELASLDAYNIFLSGPSAYVEINSPNALSEKELILFRDSFGSSLAPLLLPYYKKITLIDLRYTSMDKIEQYLDFNHQDVLFLYSTLLVNKSNLLK